jgi:hypothetical protein
VTVVAILRRVQEESYRTAGVGILGSQPLKRAPHAATLGAVLGRQRYHVLATATSRGTDRALAWLELRPGRLDSYSSA